MSANNSQRNKSTKRSPISRSKAIVPASSKARPSPKAKPSPKITEPEFQMYSYSAQYINDRQPEIYEQYLDNRSAGYQSVTKKGKTTKKTLTPDEQDAIVCQALTQVGLSCVNRAQYKQIGNGKYVCGKHQGC